MLSKMELQQLKNDARKEFESRIKNDDSNISFFPFGGDAYDFSLENCWNFINDLIDKSYETGKREVSGIVEDLVSEVATINDMWASGIKYQEGYSEAVDNAVRFLDDLDFCRKCMQMTNHRDGSCLKCKEIS